MASIVLGIMGKKRSGKDTFAARLVSEHGYTRLAFADALKESLLELDPIVDTFVEADPHAPTTIEHLRVSNYVTTMGSWDAAKQVPEVRALLQRHGVAMRNHVGEDVWVDAVARQAAEIAGPVVVTDVRFPNECHWVEGEGGATVRVVRTGLVATDTHVSETALDDYEPEYTIYNNADVAALHQQADAIAASLSPFGGY